MTALSVQDLYHNIWCCVYFRNADRNLGGLISVVLWLKLYRYWFPESNPGRSTQICMCVCLFVYDVLFCIGSSFLAYIIAIFHPRLCVSTSILSTIRSFVQPTSTLRLARSSATRQFQLIISPRNNRIHSTNSSSITGPVELRTIRVSRSDRSTGMRFVHSKLTSSIDIVV